MAAFETAEYQERITRVNANMEEAGIATLVALSEAHMS